MKNQLKNNPGYIGLRFNFQRSYYYDEIKKLTGEGTIEDFVKRIREIVNTEDVYNFIESNIIESEEK